MLIYCLCFSDYFPEWMYCLSLLISMLTHTSLALLFFDMVDAYLIGSLVSGLSYLPTLLVDIYLLVFPAY